MTTEQLLILIGTIYLAPHFNEKIGGIFGIGFILIAVIHGILK